ncbi:MAG: DUF4162 domain-containing protein [bacterium]
MSSYNKIKGLSFVHNIKSEDKTIKTYVDSGARDLPSLIEEVNRSGGNITSASIHEQTMEDVFIHYTGKSIRDEEVKKINFLVGAGAPQRWGR